MNERQLEELLERLALFSRKHPDLSPDAVKQTFREVSEVLGQAEHMGRNEGTEHDSCQLFDSGRFNDIVYAYLICAMRDAHTPSEQANEILGSLHCLLDDTPSKLILERFRGNS